MALVNLFMLHYFVRSQHARHWTFHSRRWVTDQPYQNLTRIRFVSRWPSAWIELYHKIRLCQASFAKLFTLHCKGTYNPCGLLVAGRCLQHGMNYSTRFQTMQGLFCNTLAECRVMLCKLLIPKDKLRITLEWIHSRAAASRKNPALGHQSG